mmetsp:Transcript_18470/g.54768  ORF Transcript_18470/g.54768 Transcript_18470/m.54768 type:complete len:563 (+) Transcript_18470:45-1733(+)
MGILSPRVAGLAAACVLLTLPLIEDLSRAADAVSIGRPSGSGTRTGRSQNSATTIRVLVPMRKSTPRNGSRAKSGGSADTRRPAALAGRGQAVFQLCPAVPAPGDRWVVERGVWGAANKASLHVLEAEILRPAGHGGVAVVSLLTFIADDADEQHHKVRLPHWNPLVMTAPDAWYDALIDRLNCDWGSTYVATKIRAVWFREKGHRLGLLLQCAVPAAVVTPGGFAVTLATPEGRSKNLRMCPNKYNAKRFNVVLCTTHQFPSPKIGRRDLVEWLEYHRAAGVDHVFFRDRINVRHGHRLVIDGFHNRSLQPYVEAGFVTYIPGPYHPPADWGSVYSDQLYTNTACYMRLRHAAEWIATVDLDEMIEVQQPSRVPGAAVLPAYLPSYLAALPASVEEVALMHCRLMTLGPKGEWVPHGRVPANKRRLVLPQGTMRNCREDIPAGKSIGRVRAIGFSHVHYLHAAVGHPTPNQPPCAWQWPANATISDVPPPSCVHNADYPARLLGSPHFKSYAVYDPFVGVNHGGGKWLNFRGFKGNATPAFINETLRVALYNTLRKVFDDS